jgi:hypothetical protein
MKPLSWLKGWLETPGIDDSWVAKAEAELQREHDELIAKFTNDEENKRQERAALKLMRDLYGDKS